MKKLTFILLVLISMMPFTVRSQVLAQSNDEYKLLEPLPCIAGTGVNDCKETGAGGVKETINFRDYTTYVYKFAIAISVFLAVINMFWGGFEYMTSQIPGVKIDSVAKIQNSLIGLGMILASFVILRTIDPRLVMVSTEVPKVNVPKDVTLLDSIYKNNIKDFEKAGDEKRLKVNELEIQKPDLIKKRNSIESEIDKLSSNTENLDDELEQQKIRDLRVQLEGVKGEISKIEVEQVLLISSGMANYMLKEVYDGAFHPETAVPEVLKSYLAEPVPNNLINGKYPTNSPNKIQNEYNKRLNEIGDSNPKASESIRLQRDFCIQQAKEFAKLYTDIHDYKSYISNDKKYYVEIDSSRAQTYDTTYIPRKLEQLKKNLNDTEKIKSSGLGDVDYKKIVQSQITQLEGLEINKSN